MLCTGTASAQLHLLQMLLTPEVVLVHLRPHLYSAFYIPPLPQDRAAEISTSPRVLLPGFVTHRGLFL